MNGEQARAMQETWDEGWLWWLPFNFAAFSASEYELLYELYWEFNPDEGNLYRIPMMIREED